MKQVKFLPRYISMLVLLFFILPVVVSAQEFIPLVPVPGLNSSGIDSTAYLKAVYLLAISAAALIAVVKLVLAGFKYVGSDIITDKSSAKKDIQGALIGLLIVLAAVSLLRAINPDLTNLPALESAPTIDVPPRPRAETVTNDPVAISDDQASCEARESEGYVFKVFTTGPWDNRVRATECCIPGGTGETRCSSDTTVTTEGDVTIDTATPYSLEDYQALLRDISNSGATVYSNEIIAGSEDRDIRSCTAQGGEAYIIQKDTGIANRIVREVLCVIP